MFNYITPNHCALLTLPRDFFPLISLRKLHPSKMAFLEHKRCILCRILGGWEKGPGWNKWQMLCARKLWPLQKKYLFAFRKMVHAHFSWYYHSKVRLIKKWIMYCYPQCNPSMNHYNLGNTSHKKNRFLSGIAQITSPPSPNLGKLYNYFWTSKTTS